MSSIYAFTVLNGVCLFSTAIVAYRFRKIRKSLHPRSAKQWPIPQNLFGKTIPNEILTSCGLDRTHKKYFVLFISSGCPICLKMVPFLQANRIELETMSPFIIAAPGESYDELREKWKLNRYRFYPKSVVGEFFATLTAPLLYEVKNNRIESCYLVNAGEDIISVVAPDLWSN